MHWPFYFKVIISIESQFTDLLFGLIEVIEVILGYLPLLI